MSWSDPNAPRTRIQGSYRAPENITVRFTYDPGGAATTSLKVLSPGDFWPSVDAFLTEWVTAIGFDCGPGFAMAVVVGNTADRGRIRVTTPGANFQVEFYVTGDASTLVAWLGAGGDIASSPTGTLFASVHQGGFYPTIPAEVLQRSRTTRPRAHQIVLSGNARTQHDTGTDDVDDVQLAVKLKVGDYDTIGSIGRFYVALRELIGECDGLFTLFHGTDSYLCTFAATPIAVDLVPMVAGDESVWVTDLSLRVVRAASVAVPSPPGNEWAPP